MNGKTIKIDNGYAIWKIDNSERFKEMKNKNMSYEEIINDLYSKGDLTVVEVFEETDLPTFIAPISLEQLLIDDEDDGFYLIANADGSSFGLKSDGEEYEDPYYRFYNYNDKVLVSQFTTMFFSGDQEFTFTNINLNYKKGLTKIIEVSKVDEDEYDIVNEIVL
jgi:hypothetical protein